MDSENPMIVIPTRDDIYNLRVGGTALSVFGTKCPITRIIGRGADLNGQSWVYFYTQEANGLICSNSYHEGRIVRTTALYARYTSEELDAMEIGQLQNVAHQ